MTTLKKTIEYLFYLFIFLLPWQTRLIWRQGVLAGGPWEYGTFSLYGTEILLWLILILFFIYLIFNRKTILPKKINIKSVEFIILFTTYSLLLIAITSVFWARDSSLALFAGFRLIEAVALGFFIINFNFNFKKFSWSIVTAGFIQSLLVCWQVFSQQVFASKWLGMAAQKSFGLAGESVLETTSGRFLRAYGSLPHPNILGGFLVLAIMFGIYLFFKEQNNKKALLAFCLTIFNIWGLFLTFSRSAIAAFVAAAGLYLITRFMEAKKLTIHSYLALTFLAMTLVAFIFYQDFSQGRVLGQGRLEKKSNQERQILFKEGLAVFSGNPLVGAGIGNETLAVYDQVNHQKNYWEYQPPHNIYLLVAAELGLVGILFLVAFMAASVFWAFKNKNFLGLSLMLALFIIGLFDHYLWSLYFGLILFWLVFGLGLKIKRVDS